MMQRAFVCAALVAAAVMSAPLARADQALGFYVLNQRTIALAAQYWNPILTHVSKKSGVALDLKLAETAQEGNVNAEKGKYDFLYTNHFLPPARDRLGYKVVAPREGPGIRSEIVVPVAWPIRTLQD